MMWNRNRAYLQPKICFMNCLRTYISQSRIFREKEANEIRCSQTNYLGFYTSENVYVFICFWSEISLRLSVFRKGCMFHKKLFYWAISKIS